MRRALAYLVLAVVVLFSSQGEYILSPLDEVAAPYRWNIVSWEAGNFLSKWNYRLLEAMPWHQDSTKDGTVLEEYFGLTQEIGEVERLVERLLVEAQGDELAVEKAQRSLETLRKRQSRLKSQAEEKLEAQISAVLNEEDFESRIGLIWPPVDAEFVSSPTVLVVSPREVIHRQETLTLKPNLKVEDKEALEEKVFGEQNLSALVVNIGGIATYPSIVPPKGGLRFALVTASHEWLHQYWFFRPLGWNYWRDADTTSLNETAADLAGREIGERVYEAVTGIKLSEAGVISSEENGGFHFGEEMRKTRLRTDEFLAQSRIQEAEAYMEERRRLFVENGFVIRKLNQAYFAFYGTYAFNPASVSPINDELMQFRASVDTVGEFIREVSQFSSYDEFKEHLQGLEASDIYTSEEVRTKVSVVVPGG